MLVKLAFFLALRSLILFFYEKKHTSGKILDLILFCVYTFIVIAFFQIPPAFSWHDIILAVIVALMGKNLYDRLTSKKKFAQTPALLITKSLAFCGFLLFSGIFALLRFTDDKAVVKVTLTGNTKEVIAEWKNPTSPLRKATLVAHEVKLETLSGKPIASTYLFGELAGVRAKVVRFHPLLNAFGIDNMCQIDALYNNYLTPNDLQPHVNYPLKSRFWALWEGLFFRNFATSLIKCATLESNYFPMVDRNGKPMKGSYLITINAGGLSSLPQ